MTSLLTVDSLIGNIADNLVNKRFVLVSVNPNLNTDDDEFITDAYELACGREIVDFEAIMSEYEMGVYNAFGWYTEFCFRGSIVALAHAYMGFDAPVFCAYDENDNLVEKVYLFAIEN